MRLRYLWLALVCGTLIAACAKKEEERPAQMVTLTSKLNDSIRVTSSAFEEGAMIPARYSCKGENVSPPLRWYNIPPGTKSLAIICQDPDAPGGVYTHWVAFNIPAVAPMVIEGMPTTDTLEGGARQGMNSDGKYGYTGPCPPGGQTHRYIFRVVALDATLHTPSTASGNEVLKAMEGHVLSQGSLMGKFTGS